MTPPELLRRHGAALVIADSSEVAFQARRLTTDWTLEVGENVGAAAPLRDAARPFLEHNDW